jgi:hypothetical protein
MYLRAYGRSVNIRSTEPSLMTWPTIRRPGSSLQQPEIVTKFSIGIAVTFEVAATHASGVGTASPKAVRAEACAAPCSPT